MAKLFVLLLVVVASCASGAYITGRSEGRQVELHPQGLFNEEQLGQVEKYLYDGFAVNCLDDPITKALVLRMDLVHVEAMLTNKVMSLPVDQGLVTSALSVGSNPVFENYKFNALFQKYTYFSIPFGQIRIIASGIFWC